MGIFDRLRGRSRVEIPLTALRDAVRASAAAIGASTVAPALVTARAADRVREARGEPLDPEVWDVATSGLDDDGWRRVAVAVASLAAMPMEAMVAQGAPVQQACVAVAVENPLLGTALLSATPLRCEELARKLALSCGVAIAGEDEQTSKASLERLDYARLLAESERAARDAAERLKALEERRAAQGPRRGKW